MHCHFRWRFHAPSLLLAALLFAVEVGIARHVHDAFVRPYLGDVLVVVLMYAAMKTALAAPARCLGGVALAIACVIEALQALPLVDVLGIHNRVLRIALGSTFSWADLACYAVGALGVVWADTQFGKRLVRAGKL